MTILIVEDDIASILLLTRTLKKISREVLQVKTGIEAIGVAGDNAPYQSHCAYTIFGLTC